MGLAMNELGKVLLQELRLNLTASFYHCCTLISTSKILLTKGGNLGVSMQKSGALSEIGQNHNYKGFVSITETVNFGSVSSPLCVCV